jgi:hypothetical protein
MTSAPALLEYTGTLIHAAEARTQVLDADGHTIPVLCLDIALHNLMHVEQPFPFDHYAQAMAAAHRLKKGMRVTVQAPPIDLRLIARNTAHIHIITEQKAA